MARSSADPERRKKRRKRRVQIVLLYAAIAVGLAWFFESQATTTVIFVRHAEKDLTSGDDPVLSEAGRRRAAELARQLVDADVIAGVDVVYATPFRRTEQTAKPVADALGLPVLPYDASLENAEDIVDGIVREHKGRIILMVGHSNTVPVLIASLGASKKVPEIDEDEYDNIYVVTIPWFGKTKTIRLRYGDPYVPG